MAENAPERLWLPDGFAPRTDGYWWAADHMASEKDVEYRRVSTDLAAPDAARLTPCPWCVTIDPDDSRKVHAHFDTPEEAAKFVDDVERGELDAPDEQGQTRRKIANLIPTSWLDPLLTGPEAIMGRPPYHYKDIERLLQGVKKRVETAAIRAEGKGQG